MSWYNNDTVTFDGRTTYVFGTSGEEQAFKLAVRSYPTPAVFEWPDAIIVSATRTPGNDVTVFELSVTVNDEMTYTAYGTNGYRGQLMSEIRIVAKPRGMSHSDLKTVS